MAKKKIQAKIEEAAAIAESVPEELREAAFNRALDALLDESRDDLTADELNLRDMLTPDAILGRSIKTLNFARSRIGMNELDKDQIAIALATILGSFASNERVAQVLSNADDLVTELKSKSQGITSIVRPAQGKRKSSTRTKKAKEEPQSPTQVLQGLIKNGFFATAHSAADVAMYLEKKGVDITVRQVVPALMALMNKGTLSRRKNKAGRYEYKSKKRK